MNVDRVKVSDLDRAAFHRRYRRLGVPVIITGAFEDIAAWDLDFIGEQLGDRVFPARYYGRERFTLPKSEWKEYCSFRELSFPRYAEMLRDGSAHRENVYMAQLPVGDTRLAASIRTAMEAIAERFELERVVDLNLWVGPSGHTEPLHHDAFDGTLIQIRGSKKVVLFSPEQTPGLYPFPLFSNGLAPWISQVYLDRPDHARYPRLAGALASRIEIVLTPGEMLFIPATWWHEVTALGDDYVCSINRFWKVKPFGRAVATPRTAAIYLSAKLPVGAITALHGGITRLLDGVRSRRT